MARYGNLARVKNVLEDPAKEINYRMVSGEAFSLDPFAGGTSNDKPIWDVPTINDNLNRTEWDWYTNNPGVLTQTDNVINFGFWNSQEDFFGTGYISDEFNTAFNEFFLFADEDGNQIGAFSAEQRAAARENIGLWDDLVSVRFQETSVADADIRFGNTDTGGAQAYAYLPFGTIFNPEVYNIAEEGEPPIIATFSNVEDLGGDVWVDYNVGSNFFPLEDSFYSVITLIHETGHALGLSHPGTYDALDDDDGDGVPDPITYANDAFYAQDTLQYSVMSYFDALETGAQHVDWTLMNFAYAATPLVHDISAIQAIYGVDTTTRTGDTVYGFNSTADRAAYDFDLNTRPIVTVWDAGGNDTLDFSGWATDSIIDLNQGAFSSGGGVEDFLTLAEINANRAALGFAPRTQATYDLYLALFNTGETLFRDNISIAYGAVIENAVGGGGDDLIVANQVANRLDGGLGSDTVSYETAAAAVTVFMGTSGFAFGGAAGDRLVSIENITGSKYNDVISGDAGNNIIDGGAGRDTLIGGAGIDTVSYATASAAVTVNLLLFRVGGAATGDTLLSFENITGSDFNDTLEGNLQANVIDGGAGNDTIRGGLGADSLFGGTGNDTISGGLGDDRITGGDGADRMDGGLGRDVFVFEDTDGSTDRILDFNRGQDKIDLSAIDANGATAANDNFAFIGSAAFSNVAGQLRFAGGVLQGDVNGDGVADLIVQLNVNNLNTGDLVL